MRYALNSGLFMFYDLKVCTIQSPIVADIIAVVVGGRRVRYSEWYFFCFLFLLLFAQIKKSEFLRQTVRRLLFIYDILAHATQIGNDWIFSMAHTQNTSDDLWW